MQIEQREHEGKIILKLILKLTGKLDANFDLAQYGPADIVILKLSGKLDTNTSPEAETVFNQVLAVGHHKILVNFQDLDYMSSAGLRVLLGTAKQLQGKGAVALCNMNDEVHEVLEMTGLADLIFKVFKSEEEGFYGL